jgi:hypothetical protein
MLNAVAHMRHYLRLRWNEVVVVSRQNKKIIALVDTVLVAIGIGGMIQLDLRQPILSCTASGALIQISHYFYTVFSTIYHDCQPAADDTVWFAKYTERRRR